jgi:type I restriction enzyme S subunit
LPVSIPGDWQEYKLGKLLGFANGINADKSAYGAGVPFVNVMEVTRNEALTAAQIPGRVTLPRERLLRYEVKRGDVLFNRTSETLDEVGLTSVYADDVPVVYGGFVLRGRRVKPDLDSGYAKYALRAAAVRGQIVALGQGEIRANIGQRDLKKVRVYLPGVPEQQAIAEALDRASRLVAHLDSLLQKQRRLHEGLMQHLLTGRARLPGYTAPWQRLKLAKLLTPRTERNIGGEQLEVLSCTKRFGFVRSLDYFKSQVFSRDLSAYRVIYRGDIGYPANHVEEGSIGVQELCDRGLVSPIYVVMRPRPGVDPFFVQRQLKLDRYRQEFAKVTNASVDRRGSLRWPQFSQIEVTVPEAGEQMAVAQVLRDAERGISVLELRRAKAANVKQGMTQELVSGHTRLPNEGDQ